MENNLDSNFSNQSLVLNETIKSDLLTASKWAKFLAIFGFIAIGFMVLGALLTMVAGIMVPSGFIASLVYLLIAGLYLVPTLYLFHFARNIQDAVIGNHQLRAEDGFRYLRMMFKFVGIMTIVTISLYLLIAIIGIGAMSMLR